MSGGRPHVRRGGGSYALVMCSCPSLLLDMNLCYPSSWQLKLVLTGEHHQIHQKTRGEGLACT